MLLPPLAYFDNEPPSSDRGLEDPLAVLNTMIEQRKRERAKAAGLSSDDAVATQKRERLAPARLRCAPLGFPANDVFQKIR